MKIVILAGGKGTRLFPLSRESYPKQLLPLINNKTLLSLTIERFPKDYEILIITSQDYYFIVNRIASLYTDRNITIIAEPEGKNTAPAIAYASTFFNDDDVIGVFPSDHFMHDVATFTHRLITAEKEAIKEKMVIFGIIPTFPETGYGYIKAYSQSSRNSEHIFFVQSFKEKPTLDVAKKYIEEGDYFWNAGMFVFKKSTFINEIKQYSPEIYSLYLQINENYNDYVSVESKSKQKKHSNFIVGYNNERKENISAFYKLFPAISIDYAVMEKSKIIELVRGDFGWNDIGSYDSLIDVLADLNCSPHQSNRIFDDSSNSVINDQMTENTFVLHTKTEAKHHTSLLYGDPQKFYGFIGIDDIILVDTPDALLLCKKGEAQNVKNFYEFVKNKNKNSSIFHTTVVRPWGKFSILYDKEKGYKVKQIEVDPNEILSLQLHHKRSEHWIIVKGEGIIQLENEKIQVKQGSYIFIEKGKKHRVECISKEKLVFIEIQLGDYLGEDDIERFDDKYGRIL